MSVAIPLSSMYGYDIKTLDDPCIKAADESTIEAATLLLPSNLVNIIPPLAGILASVPGSSFMKAAARVRHLTNEMMRIPTEYVEKQFVGDFSALEYVHSPLATFFDEYISSGRGKGYPIFSNRYARTKVR